MVRSERLAGVSPCGGQPRANSGLGTVRRMRAFAHDVFTYPLPEGHRFPLPKYRLVREAAGRLPGLDVQPAEAAGWEQLRRTHSADWVDRVRDGSLVRREQLALGLPWSPELVERARRATGATIAAARAALDDGVACNLGGGTHHAFAHVGRGYCDAARNQGRRVHDTARCSDLAASGGEDLVLRPVRKRVLAPGRLRR